MKPIVIYVGKEEDVKLSRKEFEKYLNEAYSAGYDAGYANACKPYISYPWWTNTQPTITTPNTQPLKITWDSDHTDYTPHITCNDKSEDTLLSHPYVTCDGANDISCNTTRTTGKATFDYKTKEIKDEKT